MRRHRSLLWLVVGIGLLPGCVERARPGAGAEPAGNSGGTTEPPGRMPDIRRDDGVYLRTDTLRYRLRREPTVLAGDIP